MRRSMAVGGAAAALALLVVGSARAEPTPAPVAAPAHAPDTKLALAEQIITATDAAGTMRRMVSAMSAGMTRGLSAMPNTGDMDKYLPRLLDEELDRMTKAILPQLAQVYADTFDEAELRDVLAFYTSPAGRKLIEKQPELARRGQALTAPLIPGMQADMLVKIFDHVCAVQKCTPQQQQVMENVKKQLLDRIKAQALAAAKEAV